MKIMIVAGEASGDMYGARLIREAHLLDPTVTFCGIGGNDMRAAGVATLADANDLAVMGLVEIFSHWRVISRAFAAASRYIQTEKPDLLVLIDYPGFNLRLAAVAKKAGVRVLYYISPKVWAWRAGRARQIARTVDHVAVIFPFEVPIYEQEGVPVSFVGHPLLDMALPSLSKAEAQETFALNPGRRTIGLFPGSRRSEILALLPVMLETVSLLRKSIPDLQFILPLAASIDRSLVDRFLAGSDLAVTVVEGKQYDVIQVCDSIIAASGTVTMEIALFGVPMVIIYKVAPLTYMVGRRLVKVAHIGISNIIMGERVVPELIQDEAHPVAIAREVTKQLTDGEHAAIIRDKLLAVRERLGQGGGSARVARLALEMASRGGH